MSILNKKNYSLLFRYGTSIIIVILALILTHLLSPLKNQTPFPLFFAAVMLSTWYGGLGPGLLATGLSAIVIDYFFLSHGYLLSIGLSGSVQLGIFVAVSIMISSLHYAKDKAEKESRENQEKFRVLLESAPDAVVIASREGLILIINAQTEFMFGYTGNELIGKDVSILLLKKLREIIPLDNPGLEGDLPLSPSGGLDLTVRRKNGREFPIGISVSQVRTEKADLVMCVIRDITERKRAEETNIKLIREQAARTEAEASMQQITGLYRQVGDANRALKLRIKELDDFTHVVSHDLKEPLRGIEAFSGFLLEDYSDILDDQGKRYLNFLKESAVRMKDLIHDLLTLASISQKAATIQEVDLNQILKKVESDLSFSIEQRGAEIRIESPLPTVNCDRVQISEVFKNIISNAIKFNAAVHPVVDIRVHEEADFYLFSVKDNGIGIDPRYADRIFQLFERLHPREEFPGTGAGLAICKKIIEGLDGRIWVESFPGDGSTFFFTIPIRVSKGDNL